MSKLSKKILKKIQKEDIKPRPKWQFILWHTLLWSLFVVSILLGSMVTGMCIYELTFTAWDFVPHIPLRNAAGMFVLPFVWLISLVLIVVLSYKLFSSTKKGYKHQPVLVILTSVLISVVLGVTIFHANLAETIDEFAHANIGPYSAFQNHMEEMWYAPDDGLIAGEIIEILSDTSFRLRACDETEWFVDIESADYKEDIVELGKEIMIIGDIVDLEEHEIAAERMHPARHAGPGQMQMSPKNCERKSDGRS